MIIIVQGPPASGKTSIAKKISSTFSFPHISRDLIQEWLSDVDTSNNKKIQSFCSHAGYELVFNLASELSKGKGSFIVEGCFNPDLAPIRMKELIGNSNHTIVEIFLTAENNILVERYLNRAGSSERHSAHGAESSRGEELAKHLEEVTYRPMRIGSKLIEIDNSDGFDTVTSDILDQLNRVCGNSYTVFPLVK